MHRVFKKKKLIYCFCVFLVHHICMYSIYLNIYTTSQMFLNSKILMFFKEFSSAHQACIYLIQYTAKACDDKDICNVTKDFYFR